MGRGSVVGLWEQQVARGRSRRKAETHTLATVPLPTRVGRCTRNVGKQEKKGNGAEEEAMRKEGAGLKERKDSRTVPYCVYRT